MTDNERIIQLLEQQNQMLKKLVEKLEPKYETKVEWKIKGDEVIPVIREIENKDGRQ